MSPPYVSICHTYGHIATHMDSHVWPAPSICVTWLWRTHVTRVNSSCRCAWTSFIAEKDLALLRAMELWRLYACICCVTGVYVCVYIYIYVLYRVCVAWQVCVCVYVNICIYIYMCVYICACGLNMCISIYVRVYRCVRVVWQVFACVCIYICIYIYVWECIYTYIYTTRRMIRRWYNT